MLKLKFSHCFETEVWLRFLSWSLVKISRLKCWLDWEQKWYNLGRYFGENSQPLGPLCLCQSAVKINSHNSILIFIYSYLYIASEIWNPQRYETHKGVFFGTPCRWCSNFRENLFQPIMMWLLISRPMSEPELGIPWSYRILLGY